ncbi:MAG: Holliday junction resolvase RuvX [Thiotrichales bacterium 17-46-47]|nr:MAG: Holliday junction resolvase RuvX [Thiotrichales bacterium 17-46-47]
MAKGVFMALDWGEKRIGLAVGQSLTGHARGLAVLKAKQGVPDWQELKKWLSKYQPEALVLGLPLLLDGKEQPLTERVREFANLLLSQIPLPLYWVEEQLSSSEASERCDNPAMLDAHPCLATLAYLRRIFN